MSTAEAKKRFRVITNERMEQDEYKRTSSYSYQTNPLREKLARFRNEEGGRRFSIRDLLMC